jgi:hypothetical protein
MSVEIGYSTNKLFREKIIKSENTEKSKDLKTEQSMSLFSIINTMFTSSIDLFLLNTYNVLADILKYSKSTKDK